MSGDGLDRNDKARLKGVKDDQAYLLRMDGKSYPQIARQLGMAHPMDAWRAVKRAMARHPSDEVEERRAIMLARIDKLMGMLLDGLDRKELFTMDRIVALMQTERELLGLDKEKTINVRLSLVERARQLADKYGLSEAEAVAVAERLVKDAQARA